MERSAARSIPEMHIVDGMSNGWSHLGVASEGGFVVMSNNRSLLGCCIGRMLVF